MPANISHGSEDVYQSSLPERTIAINIESMRFALSSFVTRVVSRASIDTLRPLPMFLGLNPGAGFCLSAQAFTPPVKKMDKGTPEKIRSRFKTNFAFFLTNYVLIAAMTALIVAMMHPGMVFFMAVLYGFWSLHSFLIRNQLVVFGVSIHAILSVQQRFYLLFTITSIVTIWKCLIPTLTFFTISSLLICTHAFMRDPKYIELSNDGSADSEDDDEEGGSSGNSNESEVLVERPRTRPTRRTPKEAN